VETTKANKATKRELIVVATMISRMIGTSVFSDGTEFSVTTDQICARTFEIIDLERVDLGAGITIGH
jgi:hypothetical protein